MARVNGITQFLPVAHVHDHTDFTP